MHAPIQYFGDIELVFRRAGHLVNPAELLKLLAGLAESFGEMRTNLRRWLNDTPETTSSKTALMATTADRQ